MYSNINRTDFRYLLHREVAEKKGSKSSKQLADLQEKRTTLHCQIQNWREVQLIYTPQVSYLLAQTKQPPETNANTPLSPPEIIFPENIPLYMPSSLPLHIRSLPALQDICLLEQRLREPQADNALADVCRQRRVIQGLWQFKKLNVSGTGNKLNTCLINLYKWFDKKTKRFAEKYQTAWQALRSLDPNGSWAIRLKELKDSDIRSPGKDANDATTSSRYEPSWIWLVQCRTEAGISEEEVNESMWAEWAKTRARMSRWNEELLLVQEEMRRVLVYHKWKALWWRTRSAMRSMDDMAILSGVSGYAHKQAAIWECMANQCACYWLPRLRARGITPSWETDYVDVANDSSLRQVREGDLGEAEDIEVDQERLDLEGNDDNDDDEEEIFQIGRDEGDFSDLDSDED